MSPSRRLLSGLTPQLTPHQVAARLDAELGHKTIERGQSTRIGLPTGFWTAAAHQQSGGRVAHLVSLSWGLPLSAELAELVWEVRPIHADTAACWYGRTNARGQFWVHGLPTGVVCDVHYVAWPRSAAEVEVLERIGDPAARTLLLRAAQSVTEEAVRAAAHAAADRLTVQPLPEFTTLADGGSLAHVCRWEGKQVTLTCENLQQAPVELNLELGPQSASWPLARVRVVDELDGVHHEGFVALIAGKDNGSLRGAANFDVLADGWRDDEGSLFLWCTAQAVEALDWRDWEALTRSHGAAEPAHRAPLEAALLWLRKVFPDRLAAEVYGVPERERIVAVLPSDDLALDEAIRAALSRVLHTTADSSNQSLMDHTRRELLGGSDLNPLDERRFLDKATLLLALFYDEDARRRTADTDTKAGGDSTTLEFLRRNPEIVRARADRWKQLEHHQYPNNRIAALIYRLHEYAEKTDEDIGKLLGLSTDSVDTLRRYGEDVVKGNLPLAEA